MTQTNPTITIREGPHPGQEFVLSSTLTVIGRVPGAEYEIIINAPGVSRRHAQISHRNNQFILEDLNSSNGTFLNGRRLTGPTPLSSGDEIGLGQAVKLAYAEPAAPIVQDVRDFLPATPDAPGGLAQTILGEALPTDAQLTTPPQLLVTIAGAPPQVYTLTKDQITIGRSETNDITVASNIVSRSHARLERSDVGYQLIVSPQAGNPVYVDGYPVTAQRRLLHNDKLRIGGQDPGMLVTMTYNSPAEAVTQEAMDISFDQKSMISIGRDPANDIVLDMPQVSRNHAEIERVGQRFRLIDLNSSNGTFVNDVQVTEEVWLRPTDTVRIGSYRFIVGEEALSQFDDSLSLKVEAIGLNKWVEKDFNILQNISLVFQPREFVVVVGRAEVLGEYVEFDVAEERVFAYAIAAAIGMFLLLQVFFRSWRLSAAIFLTLPMALVGGVYTICLVNGGLLSIGAIAGFIAVLGIAVRNSIMLIDRYRHLERDGDDFGSELVQRATRESSAVVFMTAFTSALVLFPLMVFGNIAGLEIVYPMVIVILGGLVTATIYSLVGIPALYLVFGAVRELDLGLSPGIIFDAEERFPRSGEELNHLPTPY